jgi:radical SAM protein with 4Fe4S-binding SPASM domain
MTLIPLAPFHPSHCLSCSLKIVCHVVCSYVQHAMRTGIQHTSAQT